MATATTLQKPDDLERFVGRGDKHEHNHIADSSKVKSISFHPTQMFTKKNKMFSFVSIGNTKMIKFSVYLVFFFFCVCFRKPFLPLSLQVLQLQVVSEARDVAKLQAGTKPRTVFLNIANRLAGEGSSAAGLNSSNFARTLQRDKSKKQGFPRFASYCFLLPLMHSPECLQPLRTCSACSPTT